MKYMETPKFNINYNKISLIDLEKLKNQYQDKNNISSFQPFEIEKLQAYNPTYSLFFEMTPNNFNSISLNQKYQIKQVSYQGLIPLLI